MPLSSALPWIDLVAPAPLPQRECWARFILLPNSPLSASSPTVIVAGTIAAYLIARLLKSGVLTRLLPRQIKRLVTQRPSSPPPWLKARACAALAAARAEVNDTPLSEELRALALPKTSLIWVVADLLLASLLASWGVSRHMPGHFLTLRLDQVFDTYLTMWQVQASLSTIALPLLLFLIQVSGNTGVAVLRTSEALIRSTYVYPTILYSSALVIRLPVDAILFPCHSVLFADVIFVSISLLLSLWAYSMTLAPTFSPSRLRAHVFRVQRDKMRESIYASAEQRVANNLLGGFLRDIGVAQHYSRLNARKELQFLTLRAPRSGILADIHLEGLARLIATFPPRAAPQPGPLDSITTGDQTDQPRAPTIWFVKRYGERITDDNRGVLKLRGTEFGNLDVAASESSLAGCIRVQRLT